MVVVEKESDISLKNENRRTFLYVEIKVLDIPDDRFREAERQLETYLASTHTATIATPRHPASGMRKGGCPYRPCA